MPIYEFECVKCSTTDEKLLKINYDDVIICSECGSLMKQIISSNVFRLKGNGWSKNGYDKTNYDIIKDGPEAGLRAMHAKGKGY